MQIAVDLFSLKAAAQGRGDTILLGCEDGIVYQLLMRGVEDGRQPMYLEQCLSFGYRVHTVEAVGLASGPSGAEVACCLVVAGDACLWKVYYEAKVRRQHIFFFSFFFSLAALIDFLLVRLRCTASRLYISKF